MLINKSVAADKLLWGGALAPILVWALLFYPFSLFAEEPAVQVLRSVHVISVDDSAEQIRFPSSVSYDREGDEIYISSPQKNKLVVFTSDYYPYMSIGRGRGLNSISRTFIKNNHLYVCLSPSSVDPRPQIAVYDMAFMPVRQIFFEDHGDFAPFDLVVGNDGNLYVISMNIPGVMVLGPDGRFLRWIEPKDDQLGVMEKAFLSAIDIDAKGRLYLLSEAMGRVYVYDANGRFLYKFGKKGGEAGTLSRPRGIAVDDFRQQVYIVDYQRHTMSVYTVGGEYLYEIGGKGGGRGWFYYPSDLIVDGRGRVVVADTFNHRVQVFEFVGNKGFGGREEQPEVREQTRQQVREIVHVGTIDMHVPVAEDAGDYLLLALMGRDLKNAEELQLQLSRKGYPVMLQQVELGRSGTWYQVLIGPYPEVSGAYEVLRQLQQDEKLPVVLKTRGGKAFDYELQEAEQLGEDVTSGDETLPAGDERLNEIEADNGEADVNPFLDKDRL